MPKQARKARKKTPLQRAEAVKVFGQRIREQRIRLGMTQIDLAKKAEFSLSYANRLEKGEAEPGLELALRIADALGVALNELLPSHEADSWTDQAARARQQLEAILSRKDRDALAAVLPVLFLASAASARRSR